MHTGKKNQSTDSIISSSLVKNAKEHTTIAIKKAILKTHMLI